MALTVLVPTTTLMALVCGFLETVGVRLGVREEGRTTPWGAERDIVVTLCANCRIVHGHPTDGIEKLGHDGNLLGFVKTSERQYTPPRVGSVRSCATYSMALADSIAALLRRLSLGSVGK